MFKTRLLGGNSSDDYCTCDRDQWGRYLFATLLIISLIGMSELYKILDVHNKLLGCVGYVGAILYYGLLWFGHNEWIICMTLDF